MIDNPYTKCLPWKVDWWAAICYLFTNNNYFLGPFDEHVSGNVVINKISGGFNLDLDDTMTKKFKNLRAKITDILQGFLCGSLPGCFVIITSFRRGSIIVNFLISIAAGAMQDCGLIQQLASQVNSLPATIDELKITSGNLIIRKFLILYRVL